MPSIDVRQEAAAITAALAARRDPDYEWGMRRTVPSGRSAHATRVPEVRRTATEWRRTHRDVPAAEVLTLCEALWATGWREERMLAVMLVSDSKPVLAAVRWDRLEGWSREIDNWELVDHLGGVTGRLLTADPSLLDRVRELGLARTPGSDASRW